MNVKKFLARRRNDVADSTLVTFIIVLPLFLSFIFTMIDTSVFLANRSIIQQAGRDAARTAAIYGGTGNASYRSPLEDAYGTPMSCAGDDLLYLANDTAVECGVWLRLKQGSGLTAVTFATNNSAITCGPTRANTVGEVTWCEINWTYNGIPGAWTSFISKKDPRTGQTGSYLQINWTRVSSESEVGLAGNCFVNRTTGTCDMIS